MQNALTATVEPYALLVICHSVPTEERQTLAALAAERQLPLLQIEGLISPQDLVAEVSRLTSRS